MRLHDMIQLPDQGAYVGIVFIPGTGYRVGMVLDGAFEHMSAQAAWRKARERTVDEPDDIAKALGITAGKVRAMGLAGREADGSA